MNRLLIYIFYLFIPLTVSASAGDESLKIIAAIASRQVATAQDLGTLSLFLYDERHLRAVTPEDPVMVACRKTIAQLAKRDPAIFFEFANRNQVTLRAHPYVTAQIVLAAVPDAPQIRSVLDRLELISPEVIDYLLDAKLRLDFNRKLKVALILRAQGLYTELMNEVFLEGVENSELPADLKLHAVQRLKITEDNNERAIRALTEIALLSPPALTASFIAMHELRPAAVRAIAKFRSQRSVDALWEISGLRSDPAWKPSPNLDTPVVIKLAKTERKRLLRSGEFLDRPLTERAARALRCGRLLNTPK